MFSNQITQTAQTQICFIFLGHKNKKTVSYKHIKQNTQRQKKYIQQKRTWVIVSASFFVVVMIVLLMICAVYRISFVRVCVYVLFITKFFFFANFIFLTNNLRKGTTHQNTHIKTTYEF